MSIKTTLDIQVILIIESNNELSITSIKIKLGKSIRVVLKAQGFRLLDKSFKFNILGYVTGLLHCIVFRVYVLRFVFENQTFSLGHCSQLK